MIKDVDTFIEDVRNTLLPPGRAAATTTSLKQIMALLPEEVGFTLADLALGWEASTISREDEASIPDGPVKSRAITCRELGEIASRSIYTDGEAPGRKEYAIQAWECWASALASSTDEREKQMSRTFARELTMIRK